MFNKKRKGQGYIEIMVVVAVLLIITLLAIPRYQNLRRDAYRAQTANDSKLVEAYIIENYFYNGDMPIGSQAVDNSELKELVDSKRSYLKGEIISSPDIDTIGGEKYLLDKEDVLKHVNTKLKGDFIYTDKGVIYVDNAKGSSSTEKPVDQTDFIKTIQDRINELAVTEDKGRGLELIDEIPINIDSVIDQNKKDKLKNEYENASEKFLSKFVGPVKQVEISAYHSAAITENGDLYTWGKGEYGQLGLMNNKDSRVPIKVINIPKVKKISIGLHHTAAITEDGDLYTWGSGNSGQLGHGDTGGKNVPTKVKGISNVKQVSLGEWHSAAITEDGSLYTWGSGYNGALGHGDTDNQLAPKKVEGLTNVKQVALGASHSAAIRDNGEIYAWGRSGILGAQEKRNTNTPTKIQFFSDNNLKVKNVAIGSSFIAVVVENGDLYTWGSGYNGKLGHGDTNNKDTPTKVRGISNVKQVALGGNHSAAITEDGSLYFWGKEEDMKYSPWKPIITTPKKLDILDVKQASLGKSSSAVITNKGDLYTWGNGMYGHLGFGNLAIKEMPTKVTYFNELRNN